MQEKGFGEKVKTTREETIQALNNLAVAWYSTSQKELLEQWHKEFTEGGIASMNQLTCSLADDVVTRKMVEEFVEGKEERCAWVARYPGIIENLGCENSLLAMMDI